jgi:hypothetical protein
METESNAKSNVFFYSKSIVKLLNGGVHGVELIF